MIGEKPLRQAWNAFIALLDKDPEQRFFCAECGQYPDTVILDGHALGMKQEELQALIPEPTVPDGSHQPLLAGSRHEDRVLIRSADTRTALRRFATGKDKSGQQDAVLTRQQYFELRRGLGITSPLCQVVNEATQPDQFLAKPGYVKLLKECARNTPVAGIIPLLGDDRSRQIVEQIIDGRH
jgi:hypothetical protein